MINPIQDMEQFIHLGDPDVHFCIMLVKELNLHSVNPLAPGRCCCNSAIHKDFSPSGEHFEHSKLAHELWQPTACCIAIFHKYWCYTKRSGITTNLTMKSSGVRYRRVKVPQCAYMEHGLKDIAFYVQKHITPCTVVITSLLVPDKPHEAPASMKRVYYICVSFKLMLEIDIMSISWETGLPWMPQKPTDD